MHETRILALGLVLAVAGCRQPASPPERHIEWHAEGDAAEPFAEARAACEKTALAKTAGTRSEPTATVATASAFFDCMRGHGWVATGQAREP